MKKPTDVLAIFLATSGHSGVDKIMGNLIAELGRRTIPVHLLRIKNHGPYLETVPDSVKVVNLGAAHVDTAFPALVRYLGKVRPRCMLTDKDRVNRAALLALLASRAPTRLSIRVGTTVSKNLERRGWFARNAQYFSIRTLYNHASNILVPSEGAAQDLHENFGLNKKKLHVVPSPVITPNFAKRAAEPVPHPWFLEKKAPVILGMGELCARKDFPTLIRAFARVRRLMEARLIIAGKGRKKAELSKLVNDLGLGTDVDFPGFVKNPVAWMARADLFVLSSICEGMPVVLIEALAAGTDVVSTDCPSGPRELLLDGRVAPLVPVGDSEAMARAMLSRLKADKEPERLKKAVKRYSVSESTSRYLEAIGWNRHGT